jgi:aryl-alcohol dehydrogenase-like predicted oxidoreductase
MVRSVTVSHTLQYVGLSEVSADQIRRAHAIVPITAIEQEWSLFTRDIEVSNSACCEVLMVAAAHVLDVYSV